MQSQGKSREDMKLTPDQFAKHLPKSYDKWAKHNPRYFHLEEKLRQKADTVGYLEMADLIAITRVLGNPFNIRARLQSASSEDEVKQSTAEAIRHLGEPQSALRAILKIKRWGRTYSTKTLRCISPQNYVALDSLLIRNISPTYLSSKDEVDRYVQFIGLCQQILQKVNVPGPRHNNSWFLADVEIGLFQFVWDGGRLT